MTRLELEAFLSVARHGSISAAAEQLYITQPALSRRIQGLEAELGYRLFIRDKGMRTIALTSQGQAFLSVAQKWNAVYQEAQAIRDATQKPVLNLSSIGSVSAYILPKLLPQVASPETPYNLDYHYCHSYEGYAQIEGGFSDIALIDYVRKSDGSVVISKPVFSAPFVFIGGAAWNGTTIIHPSVLDPRKEIRLPWNSAFDLWHDHWFDTTAYPRVRLDQATIIKDVLQDDLFSIVPQNVGVELTKTNPDAVLCQLENGPPDEIIYCLASVSSLEKPQVQHFMNLLKQTLQSSTDIHCLL